MGEEEFIAFALKHNLNFPKEEKKLISRLSACQRLNLKMDKYYWNKDFYNKWKRRAKTSKYVDNII